MQINKQMIKKDAEENRTSQTVIPVISSVIRIQTPDMALRISIQMQRYGKP